MVSEPVSEQAGSVAGTFEDDLERFLIAWYGPPERPATAPHPVATPSWQSAALPPSLVGWHRQAARWDAPITALNRVLGEHEVWLDGDVLVVYLEGEFTWLWGVATGDQGVDGDLRVLERENVPGSPWTPTGERLGDFLLHVAVLEAILGAPACLALDDASTGQLRDLTGDMVAVRVSSWRWPGPRHAVWQRGRALALSCVNRLPDSPVTAESTWWVVIGAQDPADLDFARRFGIAFDNDTHPSLVQL